MNLLKSVTTDTGDIIVWSTRGVPKSQNFLETAYRNINVYHRCGVHLA